jgi:hypothetical protein
LQLINIKKQSKETRRSLWLRRKARRTKKVRRVRRARRARRSRSISIPMLLFVGSNSSTAAITRMY